MQILNSFVKNTLLKQTTIPYYLIRYSISFIIRCWCWVFNYWINPHLNHFWCDVKIQYISLSDVGILMIEDIFKCLNIDDFLKIFVIETNLDSIILRELEIFVDRDLSIIGRVRLVKKTRQSWGQKVGVILKVDWHCRIKLNWIVLTTVRFVQQQNGQLSSTQLQLQSRKWTVILILYILTTCHL